MVEMMAPTPKDRICDPACGTAGFLVSDRDTKGDLYEYMLGKIASVGQNGQFRTPRHIMSMPSSWSTTFASTRGVGKGDADGEGGSTYTQHMKDAMFMIMLVLPVPGVSQTIAGRPPAEGASVAPIRGVGVSCAGVARP